MVIYILMRVVGFVIYVIVGTWLIVFITFDNIFSFVNVFLALLLVLTLPLTFLICTFDW